MLQPGIRRSFHGPIPYSWRNRNRDKRNDPPRTTSLGNGWPIRIICIGIIPEDWLTIRNLFVITGRYYRTPFPAHCRAILYSPCAGIGEQTNARRSTPQTILRVFTSGKCPRQILLCAMINRFIKFCKWLFAQPAAQQPHSASGVATLTWPRGIRCSIFPWYVNYRILSFAADITSPVPCGCFQLATRPPTPPTEASCNETACWAGTNTNEAGTSTVTGLGARAATGF